jgi:uncharacterized membrane protein
MSVLTTIAQGDASHVTEQRRAIARTDPEWRALWAIHAGPEADPPAIDLAAVTVAAAFAGEKPAAGYSITIAAAEPSAAGRPARSGVHLTVRESGPAAGGVTAQILTSPFHIVAVPKGADVVWEPEPRDHRSPASDLRPPASDLRPPASDLRPPASDLRPPASDLRPPASGLRPPATDLRPPTSDLRPPTSDLRSSTGLEPRTASALAYLAGPFSGALILAAESTNREVRFHAWQSIVGLGGLGLAVIVSYILAFVALFVSATAMSLMLSVAKVIWIVLAIVWALCLWKAWSGERWKLPLAGDYAERFV